MVQKPDSYQLLIHLDDCCCIQVGALGQFTFEAGYYLYSGSAKRNLQARLARHCRKNKPLRWHIDYLTSQAKAKVIETNTFSGDECQLNQDCTGSVIAPGFGASDCNNGCGAHLKYLGKKRP
jgi:Uri superfamily endonuclease